MMTKRNQHIATHANGWAVKGEGASKPSSIHSTQQEAINRGRKVSRNQGTELFIHGRDGRIRARDSHGDDPYLPKALIKVITRTNVDGYFCAMTPSMNINQLTKGGKDAN